MTPAEKEQARVARLERDSEKFGALIDEVIALDEAIEAAGEAGNHLAQAIRAEVCIRHRECPYPHPDTPACLLLRCIRQQFLPQPDTPPN